MLFRPTLSLAFPLLAGCAGAGKTPEIIEPGGSSPSFEAQLRATMDPSVDPCTDFYAYACGGWLATNPLPADRAIVVRAFTTIQDNNEAVLRQVLEGASASADPSVAKLGAYWKSCTDEAAIAARGAQPLEAELARVAAVADKAQFLSTSGRMILEGLGGVATVFVDADAKDPDLILLQLTQGGTGLPERSYYLDPSKAELRDAYRAYAVTMFGLAGYAAADAEKAADTVLAFETRLAEVQWAPEALRDADATYNRLDRAGLESLAAGLDWGAFLSGLGQPDLTKINVLVPPFFAGLATIVNDTPIEDLRTYLAWRVIDGSGDELAPAFDDAKFGFYGRTLSGQQEQRPRWKRCVEVADGSLGDLLAQAYVAKAFAGESKPVAVDMIGRVEAAFEAGLPEVGWMDDETRTRASEKVHAIANKIGYPETFRTYDFAVDPADYYGNNRRARASDLTFWLDQVGKPVDPDTWLMTAHTVNAYYNPPQNEIVFPAGILQPPFFSVDYPKAINFGAMGMVMGHEITHGFDDQGRKYDGSGRLTDWWTPGSVSGFETAAACVDNQYDAYEIAPGTHLNGELTLGENIADLGGLRLAYRAYRSWVDENGEEPPVAGLTGDQLVFLAHAQAWCSASTPEVAKVRAATDPHAAPKFRVNGPLVNLPEFAEAFGCEVGAPMRPASTCEVW